MDSDSSGLAERVRRCVELLNETDLTRLRIDDADGDYIEVSRAAPRGISDGVAHVSSNGVSTLESRQGRLLDLIKADLVGIARLSKPVAEPGAKLEGDRELAYVEALGIRNPVRSLGTGRIRSVLVQDGQPVEFGQPLFEIERE
ncbi:MAG: acetyl-CoA carboxylase biotin carboxyl carrier protein [Vulcanimicrobiaceae bacterium]